MKRERNTQLIEKRIQRERVQKARERRYSKKDVENMDLLLIQAKSILGLV